MKRSCLFLLVSLVFISGPCSANNDEIARLADYISKFEKLSVEEKVAQMAKKDFLDGKLSEDPEIAALFKKYDDKRLELYRLVQGLKPQVKEYCMYRLDDVYQDFLKQFEEKPANRRGSITFDFREGHLETYLLPKEEVALLEKMPKEQEEPFYVLATLIQMDSATQRPNGSKESQVQKGSLLKRLLRVKKPNFFA